VQVEWLGVEPWEKTDSNLWPSDHAGVGVTVRPIPGRGNSH